MVAGGLPGGEVPEPVEESHLRRQLRNSWIPSDVQHRQVVQLAAGKQ